MYNNDLTKGPIVLGRRELGDRLILSQSIILSIEL